MDKAIAAAVSQVSTHSRPKAAGSYCQPKGTRKTVSTHSRPKAAGEVFDDFEVVIAVSTHSRPKAAGWADTDGKVSNKFQHTAARRRLGSWW